MHLDRVGQGTLMMKINDFFIQESRYQAKKKMIVKMEIFLTLYRYYLYHLLFAKEFGQ